MAAVHRQPTCALRLFVAQQCLNMLRRQLSRNAASDSTADLRTSHSGMIKRPDERFDYFLFTDPIPAPEPPINPAGIGDLWCKSSRSRAMTCGEGPKTMAPRAACRTSDRIIQAGKQRVECLITANPADALNAAERTWPTWSGRSLMRTG